MITAPAEHYSEEDIKKVVTKYSGGVFQLERGQKSTDTNPEGYLHWQIYVEHAAPIRFSTLRNKLPKAHVEKREGTRSEAYLYCSKSDTRVPDTQPFAWGEVDLENKQGKRVDLELIHAAIVEGGLNYDDVLNLYPQAMRFSAGVREVIHARDKEKYSTEERDVRCYYLYGAAGIGKTSAVLRHYGLKDIYRVSNYKNPFDNYDKQPVLVLDEFIGEGTYKPQIAFDEFLNILDRYPMMLPCRYHDKWAAFTTVWVISNLPFEYIYRSERAHNSRDAALRRRFDGVYRMTNEGYVREKYKGEPCPLGASWVDLNSVDSDTKSPSIPDDYTSV